MQIAVGYLHASLTAPNDTEASISDPSPLGSLSACCRTRALPLHFSASCLPPSLPSPPTHFTPPQHRRGPTLQEVLEEGEYEMQPLPSDEAWFGEPDTSIYAAGTNDLTKEQLDQEVAKGNVCTLRQLKQHLLTASDEDLEVRARREMGPRRRVVG
mgnify:CR=1 FL=1